MKYLYELTEKQRKQIIKNIQATAVLEIKSLFTMAENYDINKEELFDLWQYYEQKCFNHLQAKGAKGITVDEGIRMLKTFLELGKGETK